MPWVRTRLRAATGAACALALLVALTACLAAAFPRAVDRYEDSGLRRAAEQARPDRTVIEVYAPPPSPMDSSTLRENALRPDALAAQDREVRARIPGPLVIDRGQSAYGVRSSQDIPVLDPWLPRPTGDPPQMTLVAQSGLAAHSSVAQGRLPRADGQVTATTDRLEAAVSTETAKALHIKVGSVLHTGVYTVRVTGIVTPRDPQGAYWSTKTVLRTPAVIREPLPSTDMYWVGALLLAPDAGPALLARDGRPERYWQLAPDVRSLRARDIPALRYAISSLEAGPALREVRRRIDGPSTELSELNGNTEVTTDFDDVLIAYDRIRDSIAPLVAVAAFGTGTVAAVVLLMAGGLSAERRRSELALLRARGVSLRGLTARLLAETAAVAVPAGAVGLGVALLAVPADRAGAAAWAAAAVTAVAATSPRPGPPPRSSAGTR
ncbi:FtsX-like permease family protein, partial [Streptomyces griseorubiginosus]|uniref:FtsX-like permease family protein n=1 Tax=Streptomyces griseorubiginosus TaxID=67304 RepID=UPI0033E9FDE3